MNEMLFNENNFNWLAKLLLDTWGLVEGIERAEFLEGPTVIHLSQRVEQMANDKFMREDG